jgi:hypothetical protein
MSHKFCHILNRATVMIGGILWALGVLLAGLRDGCLATVGFVRKGMRRLLTGRNETGP